MTEEQSNWLGDRIMSARREHGYPGAVVKTAGVYHVLVSISGFVGAALLMINRDAVVGGLRDSGKTIEQASSVGYGITFLAGITLFFGVLFAWVAYGLLRGRASVYWSAILLNAFWVIGAQATAGRGDFIQIVQLGVSAGIVVLFLFDPRVKAWFHRGRYADEYWQTENTLWRAKHSKPVPQAK
jgi:hypothetical protein